MTPCPSDFYDSNSDWESCGRQRRHVCVHIPCHHSFSQQTKKVMHATRGSKSTRFHFPLHLFISVADVWQLKDALFHPSIRLSSKSELLVSHQWNSGWNSLLWFCLAVRLSVAIAVIILCLGFIGGDAKRTEVSSICPLSVSCSWHGFYALSAVEHKPVAKKVVANLAWCII